MRIAGKVAQAEGLATGVGNTHTRAGAQFRSGLSPGNRCVGGTTIISSPSAPGLRWSSVTRAIILHRVDVVYLIFPLSPELKQTLTVQPDGFINLENAGSLYVQG